MTVTIQIEKPNNVKLTKENKSKTVERESERERVKID
jgi:hypothetical protein